MDYRSAIAQGAALSQVKADALVLVLAPEHSGFANVTLDRLVQAAIDSGDFALKAGRSLYLHHPADLTAPRLLLVAAANAQTKSLKAAVAKGVAALKDSAAAHIAVAFADGLVSDAEAAAALAQAAVLAVADASYVFRDTKPSAPKPSALKKITLLHADAVAAAVKSGLAQGEAIAEGVTLARHLGNLPANHCTPTHLAAQARKLGKAHKHVAVQVLERPALEKLGMGSFLSVTNGSAEPPKFIVLRYEGGSSGQAPVVLVGKGITFDTGGISLKPGAGMDEMKFDMGGAASVLGTFESLARLKPKLNVIGLIPTCENMPSGTATKPGDVVTSMSGQTIEVLNTDAEGRLILCDALTYAERFKPAVVVDIATLTGACVIALGNVHSGLFSGDDELAQALLNAGQTSLDTAWRLPLDEEYGESLKSNFADMGNVGGREGGAITAAVFLSKFTKAYRWAHLDIAGTAWKSGGAKGGTGRPVGLLTQFLLDQAAAGKAALQPKAAAKAPAKTVGKTAGKTAGQQASAKSASTQGAGAKRATAKSAPQA